MDEPTIHRNVDYYNDKKFAKITSGKCGGLSHKILTDSVMSKSTIIVSHKIPFTEKYEFQLGHYIQNISITCKEDKKVKGHLMMKERKCKFEIPPFMIPASNMNMTIYSGVEDECILEYQSVHINLEYFYKYIHTYYMILPNNIFNWNGKLLVNMDYSQFRDAGLPINMINTIEI
jgi:hypothetical protein